MLPKISFLSSNSLQCCSRRARAFDENYRAADAADRCVIHDVKNFFGNIVENIGGLIRTARATRAHDLSPVKILHKDLLVFIEKSFSCR